MKDKEIELVINTVAEFAENELSGYKGAALAGRKDMLTDFGKKLILKLNEATVSERNLLFGFIKFSNQLETERSQIPKSRANIYLAHKNK